MDDSKFGYPEMLELERELEEAQKEIRALRNERDMLIGQVERYRIIIDEGVQEVDALERENARLRRDCFAVDDVTGEVVEL